MAASLWLPKFQISLLADVPQRPAPPGASVEAAAEEPRSELASDKRVLMKALEYMTDKATDYERQLQALRRDRDAAAERARVAEREVERLEERVRELEAQRAPAPTEWQRQRDETVEQLQQSLERAQQQQEQLQRQVEQLQQTPQQVML